jgi:hypothetical protein
LVRNDTTLLFSVKLATRKVQGPRHDPRLLLGEIGARDFWALIAQLVCNLLPV